MEGEMEEGATAQQRRKVRAQLVPPSLSGHDSIFGKVHSGLYPSEMILGTQRYLVELGSNLHRLRKMAVSCFNLVGSFPPSSPASLPLPQPLRLFAREWPSSGLERETSPSGCGLF